MLQGFSAGVMQPMIMALIFTQFPPERRGQAMAVHGTGIQIAPMLGPMIGGMIIDTVGWREIFLVPLPVCVVSLLFGMVYLPGREEAGPPAKIRLARLLAGGRGAGRACSSPARTASVMAGAPTRS